MSNNDGDGDLPSFEGNRMLQNVSFADNEDDIGEETTRRIGGLAPSFAPINVMVSPSVTSFGSDLTTRISKTIATTNATRPVEMVKPRIESSKLTVSTSSAWKLKSAPWVPPFGHPLEPTTTFVPHVSAKAVAQRVGSILQERNIQATYKKSRAKCLTLDNVEFNVFLYQGKNEYSHGVILEVQRWSGNNAAFYEDTKAILNGAKDDHRHTHTHTHTTTKTTVQLPVIDDTVSDFDNYLDKALEMLRADKDSQLLGLQILSSLTDSSKVGSKAASAVSLKLASPYNKVLSEVFGIVAESDDSSFVLQAMITLSNIALFDALPTKDIRRSLVSLITSNRTQVAYLAAKCLAPHQIDSFVAGALQSAEKLGEEMHHPGLCLLSNSLLHNST